MRRILNARSKTIATLLMAAVVGAGLCAGPALAAQAELGQDAAGWHRVDTQHFVLLGDVPAPTLRALASDLEALESLLATLNPNDSTPAPARAAVMVFASEEEFSRYAPFDTAGEPAAVSGFFLRHPHGDYVAVSAGGRDVRPVLYHEVLHRFVCHHLPEAPLWLNEGLAEFYSTLEVSRGEAWLGRPVVEHVVRLQRDARRPLSELVAIDAESHVYHDGELQGAFYAEAWALVHYLLDGDDSGRAALARYAGLLRAGEDPGSAFAAVFGDEAELERRIDRHLRRAPVEPLRAPLGDPERGGGRAAAPVTEAELHYRLGWLLSHHSPPRSAAARSHFEAALRADPGHTGATTGMGWLDELEGDHDAARESYARASALDPRDPLPPFLEAQSLLSAATSLPDDERAASAAQELYEAARDGFRRSLRLEPRLAEAWAGLGAAWVAKRSPSDEGLEALREAFRRLPTRDDVLYNLTLLEARLGSRDRAAALLARLERRTESGNRDLATALAVRLEELDRAMAGGGGN
jgi:tetratricopeptide (TPR) repeat protein